MINKFLPRTKLLFARSAGEEVLLDYGAATIDKQKVINWVALALVFSTFCFFSVNGIAKDSKEEVGYEAWKEKNSSTISEIESSKGDEFKRFLTELEGSSLLSGSDSDTKFLLTFLDKMNERDNLTFDERKEILRLQRDANSKLKRYDLAQKQTDKLSNVYAIEDSEGEGFIFYLTELVASTLLSGSDSDTKFLLTFLDKMNERDNLTFDERKEILRWQFEANSKLKRYDLAQKQTDKLSNVYAIEDREHGGLIFHLKGLVASNLVSGSNSDTELLLKLLNKIDKERKGELTDKNRKDMLYLRAKANYKLKRYDLSQEQFLQLKLILTKTDDPLFLEVNKKLKEIPKKKRQVEILSFHKKLKMKYLIYFGLPFLALIALVILPFYLWHKKYLKSIDERAIQRDKKGFFESDIIPENKMIELKDICELDGRVLFSDAENYQKTRKKDKNARYAPIVVEGYDMIKRVNRHAPYPVACLSKIPKLNGIPYFWKATLFGFFFIYVWALLGPFIQNPSSPSHDLAVLFLIATLTILSLIGLRIMSERTIMSLGELVSIMEFHKEDEKSDLEDKRPVSIRKLEEWVAIRFRSPLHFCLALIIFSLVIVFDYYATKTDFNILKIDYIFVAFIVLIVSPIICLLLSSLVTLNRICDMEDLSINPLSPIKTIGLEKWLSLIGTYAVVGSVVLTFGCLIPIVDNYLSDKRRPDDWFWFIIIIPMLIVYWFYPYVKIAGVVKSLKSKRKQFFKIRMSQCFNDWVSSDLYSSGKEITPQKQMLRFDLTTKFAEEMDNYYKMFKKIDESPESFLDIYSALELLQAIGLPSLFAIATYFFF